MPTLTAVDCPEENEELRLNQLKEVFNIIMRKRDPFTLLKIEAMIRFTGITACMHQGKQIDNPTYFTSSITNSCEYYMGQLLYHFEIGSSWIFINMDLNCIEDYLNEVGKKYAE